MMKIEMGGPPEYSRSSHDHYNRGFSFGKDARDRYGYEACQELLRKYQHPATSYEAGAFDAIDGKPHRYESK